MARQPLPDLMDQAAAMRDAGHGSVVTYSRKVFIPLTQLCRDVCHYCTFAQVPRHLDKVYLGPDDVLAIARGGQAQGCKEALFTLGDKPERRYRAAREALDRLGYDSTLAYLKAMAELVLTETGLLPHLNPGVLTEPELVDLRPVAPSMGLMLESASARLCQPGGPHFGSPDKDPQVRLQSLRAAGRARVPLTSGILIGIGETRQERLESLLALKAVHDEFGHLQEIIVQNFVPKPGTKMHQAPAPECAELLWTVAVARLIFGSDMSIQVPPNLNAGRLDQLIGAGINDWGGVSPVTPDHVNPESPWPHLDTLARATRASGKQLSQRLTVYPKYVLGRERWIDDGLIRPVLALADSEGLGREDDWTAGASRVAAAGLGRDTPPEGRSPVGDLASILTRARAGDGLAHGDVLRLLQARGDEVLEVATAADELRRDVCGDTVSYVVNRNINYTNVCYFKCTFCAFSKGKANAQLRGAPYLLDLEEIGRRSAEAWQRGATEVCMQGGIHPDFTGQTYIDIVKAVKAAAPDIHVHAFSPLEITQGAATLGMSVSEFLGHLGEAGLASLPGTAAEILDDHVRARLCPDKIDTAQWLHVVESAHQVGLPTTATIMFGHLEGIDSWATHLLTLRALQARSGGLTELVPLPFVPMEAPLYRRGRARPGPTYREVVLLHAVARLVLYPLITNIQVSWPKLGPAGAAQLLKAGANDLGGTLMNESISRAAGARHGQELPAVEMEALIVAAGRQPRQRNTLYGAVSAERRAAARTAPAMTPIVNRPLRDYQRAR
jgi:FO synthase